MKDKAIFTVTLVMFSFIFMVISSGNAKADACTPASLYAQCGEYSNYGAYAKLQNGNIHYAIYEGKHYFTDSELKVRCDGDRLYLYDGDKAAQCDEDGCPNAITTIPTGIDTAYDFANFVEGIQPQLVCWDKGSSGYVYLYATWDTTFYAQTHECSSDSGCGADEYCNDTNPYEVTCSKLNCKETDIIINNRCVPAGIGSAVFLLLSDKKGSSD